MASLERVVEQIVLLAAAGNKTIGANATAIPSVAQGPLDFLSAVSKSFFTTKALRDWAIILIIGSLFETGRRLLSGWWSWLINSFFLTAVFDEDDDSYQWILLWLSKQPSWKQARHIQISTSNFGLNRPGAKDTDWNDEPLPNLGKISYIPSVSESYTLWHKYRWMNVRRLVESQGNGWSTRETLTLSIFTRDHRVLQKILEEAKKEYLEAQKDSITIYVSASRFGSGDGWKELATRPKRPLNSIILDPGIVDLVVEDARDFLDSKQWYSDRGIPFRRGYLLYGAPGSGKTSLIHSIAGELGLDVYIVSLSRSGLDDTSLAELISDLPERCIALMEDIDAAFHHGLSRESSSPESSQMPDEPDQQQQFPGAPPAPSGNRVSLSGLLNALDGIAAQEGRILFATTNKYSSLDPALCRPGRMDLHVEFKHASRYQAEELFKRFYAPASSGFTSVKNEIANGDAGDDDDDDDAPTKDLIDLSEKTDTDANVDSDNPSPASAPTPAFTGVAHRLRMPKMPTSQILKLASQFASLVPERQISMASLQGYLMTHKTSPVNAVEKVSAWVEQELAEREKRATGA